MHYSNSALLKFEISAKNTIRNILSDQFNINEILSTSDINK